MVRRNKTLSGRLALFSTLSIAVVGLIFLAFFFLFYRDVIFRTFVDRSEAQSESLSQNLSLPVWNYSDDIVEYICEVFIAMDDVASLKVEEKYRGVLFDRKKEGMVAERPVVVDILFKEMEGEESVIGQVEVGYSFAPHREQLTILFFLTLILLAFVISAIIVVSIVGLRILIKAPLDRLAQIVTAIEKGDYNIDTHSSYQELEALRERFSAMGERVAARERTLRDSESRSRALLNASPDMILLVSGDGALQFLSGQWVYTGRERLLMAERIIEILKENRISGLPAFEYVLEHRMLEVLELDLEFDRKNYYFECRIVPFADEKLMIQLRDISEMQAAVEQKRLYEERLHQGQKLEAIGTLAGGVAHDFNNILGIIISYSEELREGENLDRDLLGEIEKAAFRAKDVVSQLLSFSRPAEGDIRMIDLVSVVREAGGMVRASVPATVRMDIELQAEKNELFIKADPTKIYQIILNLCTNAYQAVGQGGSFKLELKRDNPSRTMRAGHPDLPSGELACIQIVDDGPGMDQETLDRIFEPFFTTKEVGEGSGLGLAIVFGIVKAYDGALIVESELGVGTRFSVYFKLLEDEENVPVDEKSANEGLAVEGARCIVVDDESAILTITKKALERKGCVVSAFASAPEALKAFEAESDQFDFMVTDLTMPEMTGEQLIQAVHALRPDFPVVITTGYTKTSMNQIINQQDNICFLQKPYSRTALYDAVASLFR